MLAMRRLDRVPNAWIRELCGAMKGVDERIVSAMWKGWRGIGLPRECVGKYVVSRLVGRSWKRWIDTTKECLRKEVWQARRTVG